LLMPLNPEEIKDLLAKPVLAHLAVTKGGLPKVTPIWVYYENHRFYFTTRGGRVKGMAIRSNPEVALSIATDSTPYKAVVVEGRAMAIENDKWYIISKIIEKYVTVPYGKKEGDRLIDEWHKETDRFAYVVQPSRILSWNYGKGDLKRQDEGVSMSTQL